MKLDLHYVDPRLVSLYDRDNPRGIDYDFFLALAEELEAKRIVDLGCGTGLLAREFSEKGYEVIGVDPATEMLAYARKQPGADQVRWIEGDAGKLEAFAADLAYMTGNVAQVFLEDDAWLAALQGLHRALKPGGTLAFDTRNPAAKAWEDWTPENTRGINDSPFGRMEEWLEVTEVTQKSITFKAYNIFLDSGEQLVIQSTLRFRTLVEIEASLQKAGFEVKSLFGDWQKEPFVADSRKMLFVCVKV